MQVVSDDVIEPLSQTRVISSERRIHPLATHLIAQGRGQPVRGVPSRDGAIPAVAHT